MNVMDYENSKRFRRNKLEEDDNISDNEMENEEWDEGFGAEEFISFDEELPEYDENNPTPTCFSRWYDIQKYYYHGKIPLPIQLPKDSHTIINADLLYKLMMNYISETIMANA